VICGSTDRNLYLLDLEHGREVWRYAADGAFIASPALAEGRLVISDDKGLVHCFDVSARRREESAGGGGGGSASSGSASRESGATPPDGSR